MPHFAQKIISVLEAEPYPREAMDAIAAAADCLSKARMVNFSPGGVHPEIDAEGVTEEEARLIERALARICQKHEEAEGIATVIWALTKACNPEFKPLFRHHASSAMKKMMNAYGELSQAVCGLEDFEPMEEPLSDRSQMMAETVDRADAYLRRAGIVVPFG